MQWPTLLQAKNHCNCRALQLDLSGGHSMGHVWNCHYIHPQELALIQHKCYLCCFTALSSPCLMSVAERKKLDITDTKYVCLSRDLTCYSQQPFSFPSIGEDRYFSLGLWSKRLISPTHSAMQLGVLHVLYKGPLPHGDLHSLSPGIPSVRIHSGLYQKWASSPVKNAAMKYNSLSCYPSLRKRAHTLCIKLIRDWTLYKI